MNNLFKKHYEIFLFLIVLILIALIIFLLIKTINILSKNFDKALTIPNLSEKNTNFNIQQAILILQKRKLIQ
ncbi:MAG: hypothetical protein NZ484_00775 [Patescibacteria group bacterium]|nr:hypothetical protein [Patescibacteria group bacterium]MDW8279752.1 hypothetical protein [bacterium]